MNKQISQPHYQLNNEKRLKIIKGSVREKLKGV